MGSTVFSAVRHLRCRRGRMDRSAFITACKGAGLKVSKKGVLTDTLRVYGAVDIDTVLDPNTKEPYGFILEDVDAVRFMRDDKKIELTLIDGSTQYLYGQYDTDDAGNIIVPSMKMPASQSELDDLMDIIFPGIDDKLYFDVLSEQGMVDPTLFEMEPEEGEQFVPLTDEMYPFYYDCLERKLRGLGLEGRFPSRETRDLVLKKRLLEHKRNLFLEWVQFKEDGTPREWDGVPRMRSWFMTGIGATAPPLWDMGKEEQYIGDMTEAWFIGGISRMFKETKVEVVPVLIGGEGIGKGNFLRYTAGYNDDWFIDTSASLEGPGAEERMMEGIRGCVIVELSESTQFSTVKGAELLKTFVSKSRDKRRKAYARESSVSIRRFILVATSNKNNVFLDVGGGNRRYFPVYCDPNKAEAVFDPKYKVAGRYEVEQVWAEALHKYLEDPNANSYISKETAELAAIMQEYGTVENSNVNMIDEWLNDPINGYSEIGAHISKEEIFTEILGVAIGAGVIPTSAEYAFKQWADIQKCWRKLPKAVRVGGKVTRHVYERVYTIEEIKIKRRANMVNILPGHEDEFIDVVGIMRSRAKKYGFSRFDDPFPIDGLSQIEIDTILDKGYIYTPDNKNYYLVSMP